MTVTTTPPPGKHRRGAIVPQAPDDTEKYAYDWRSLPYLTTILSIAFCSAMGSQIWFEANADAWPLAPFTAIGVIAFAFSLPLCFCGRGYDIQGHVLRVRGWQPVAWPDVDVFLPVCGEPIEVLRNTWAGVFELVHAYPGVARAYVLDDAADPAARQLAGDYGFTYWVRPDRGLHKKSGNLRHAFAHTSGQHIAIFDADFRPRPDFLAETLPYMDDQKIAIVQTPQFFRSHPGQSWIERAAGAIQEVFYRSIQTARDRLGASICVGSCALYRRAALAPQGGTTLIDYAEDVHTGLDVRRAGWALKYVPVVLCAGICPDGLAAFIRQQYRWCTGSTSTILTGRLWSVPMSKRARLTYVSGFCYYLFTAISVFVIPLIPIGLLAFMAPSVEPRNFLVLAPAIVVGLFLYPIWHYSEYELAGILPLSLARGWAHALAIWDYSRGRTMSWQASGGGVSTVARFKWGVLAWNGTAAVTWLALFTWRTLQYGSPRFAVLGAFGVLNLAVVGRVAFPGRGAA
jgi:cellulose synthase (UDP-forming)